MHNPYLEEAQPLITKHTMLSASDNRRELCKKYAWAIPTAEAVNKIASFGPIIEICAGTGYWASLIAQATDIVAYDLQPFKNHYCEGSHFPVLLGGYDAFVLHPERILFMCWPPYQDDEQLNKALRQYKQDTIVYVGEGHGGCTANLDDCWEVSETMHLPQWYGLHDYLAIYRRSNHA